MQFSYLEYQQILNVFSDHFCSFIEAKSSPRFTILRHDVEFSVGRALKMAQIEDSMGVKSTYFFQVMSNAYNPFSVKNLKSIHAIAEMGHVVGLHAYISHLRTNTPNDFEKELTKQKTIFEKFLELRCEVFSFHRPPMWALNLREDEICEMINAYGQSFFELSEHPKRIKYLADSKHSWSYGHPLEKNWGNKVQLLIHPDEWTDEGDKNLNDFFDALKREHTFEFSNTLRSETKHYQEFFGDGQ